MSELAGESGAMRSNMNEFEIKSAVEMEAHINMNAAAAKANFDKYYKERLQDVSKLWKDQKRRLDVREPLDCPVFVVDVGQPKFDFPSLPQLFDDKLAERVKRKEERKDAEEPDEDVWNKCFNQDEPLKLKLNGVDYTNIDKVVKAIKDKTNVERLEISNCGLEADDCDALTEFLKTNKSVKTFDLSGNKFGSEGMEKLVVGFTENTTITDLDLSGGGLAKSAAKHIGAVLKHDHCRLERLQLAGNTLGIYGIEDLVNTGLLACKTLKTLGIQNNNIGNDGAQKLLALFDGESPNTCIIQLNCEANKVDDANLDKLKELCWGNEKLQMLFHLCSVEAENRGMIELEVQNEIPLLEVLWKKIKSEAQQKENERQKKEEETKVKAAPGKSAAKQPAGKSASKTPAAKSPAAKPATKPASKSPTRTPAKTASSGAVKSAVAPAGKKAPAKK